MTFLLVGHRGAMGLEPENTLRSFLRAESEGVDQLEMDLHLSRDGELVIMHDLTVDRTTNGSGPIAELTLAELKALEAGLGEQIPTFDEVLDAVTLPMQAEVKAADAARATVDTIRDRGLLDRIVVTSFSAEVMRATKEYLPDVRTGLIMSKAPADSIDRAKQIGADVLCVGLAPLTEKLVDRAHEAELEVIGWPANYPEQLVQAFRVGADGVTTDFPNLLADTLGTIPRLRDVLSEMEERLSHRLPASSQNGTNGVASENGSRRSGGPR